MGKIFIRGVIIFGTFFAGWFVLKQIDWLGILTPDFSDKNEYVRKIEEKLGELTYDDYLNRNDLIEDEFSVKVVDSLVTKICISNQIEKEIIKVYLFENDEVNAFALPDRQLIIYTGLINKTKSQEALCGVIAHELAHIEKNHVMKSLTREMGLGVLFAIISGNADVTILADIAKMLSSSAFSREMEREADLTGVEYLKKAKIDPNPFAEFIGILDDVDFSALKWVGTHPMSKERKKYILKSIEKQDVIFEKVISQDSWETLKDRM